MVDESSLVSPDITQILQRCKDKNKMLTHQALIETHFKTFYAEYSKRGCSLIVFRRSTGSPPTPTTLVSLYTYIPSANPISAPRPSPTPSNVNNVPPPPLIKSDVKILEERKKLDNLYSANTVTSAKLLSLLPKPLKEPPLTALPTKCYASVRIRNQNLSFTLENEYCSTLVCFIGFQKLLRFDVARVKLSTPFCIGKPLILK